MGLISGEEDNIVVEESQTKVCKKCGVEKPRSEFHMCSDKKDGLAWQCKSCKSIQSSKYRIDYSTIVIFSGYLKKKIERNVTPYS
jgi:hypothetical protein